MNINWKAKLSSRKFWVAAVGYITSVLTAFGAGDNTIVQVSAIVGGLGVLIVYILAEAHVDGKSLETPVYNEEFAPIEGDE